MMVGPACCHAGEEAGRGKDAIVGPQDTGPQPADIFVLMVLMVDGGHGIPLPSFQGMNHIRFDTEGENYSMELRRTAPRWVSGTVGTEASQKDGGAV